jgi:DNA-binding transcriptional LysR family regulator
MLPQMRVAKAAGMDRTQISVNSFAVQLESVRRGMGVAVLLRILAKDLIGLFPDIQLPDMEVYLVTRPQALKQAHIKCFFVILEQVLLEAHSMESVEGYLLGGRLEMGASSLSRPAETDP